MEVFENTVSIYSWSSIHPTEPDPRTHGRRESYFVDCIQCQESIGISDMNQEINVIANRLFIYNKPRRVSEMYKKRW